MTTAGEVMTRAPVTIRLSARVREAIEVLDSLEVRHLPVVNEDGELIGMLSDRTLDAIWVSTAGERARHLPGRAVLDAPLSSLMSGHRFAAVEARTDAARVIGVMLDSHVGAVPVVDPAGALLGLVSYMDVLRAWPFPAVEMDG